MFFPDAAGPMDKSLNLELLRTPNGEDSGFGMKRGSVTIDIIQAALGVWDVHTCKVL